ncbi:hypothetical protein, partial [Thiolapillus sp.]
HENHFSRRVPWHEKWAIGLSWPRPGAQKHRNQGIGERCGLENKNNRGDGGDLFSNTAAGLSHDTAPSSDLYAGIASNFSATNISATSVSSAS